MGKGHGSRSLTALPKSGKKRPPGRPQGQGGKAEQEAVGWPQGVDLYRKTDRFAAFFVEQNPGGGVKAAFEAWCRRLIPGELEFQWSNDLTYPRNAVFVVQHYDGADVLLGPVPYGMWAVMAIYPEGDPRCRFPELSWHVDRLFLLSYERV